MNQIARHIDGTPGGAAKTLTCPADVIVRYRPFAELERWFKYRLEEKSKVKAYFFWGIGILFFVLGGPVLVLQGVTLLIQILGAGAGGVAPGAVAATQSIVGYFYLSVAALLAAAAGIYYTRPTHLALNDRGIRYLYRHSFFGQPLYERDGQLISWEKISQISIDKPSRKPSPSDHMLTFRSGSVKALKARLGSILTTEERARLLNAIENYAPAIPCEATVVQALEPPPDHSYTELWMKALSAPPKRERLKPLVSGAVLRDNMYKVVCALGVGGQGTAYLAKDLSADGNQIVLKEFILPVYVDIAVRRQALEKFEKEARILKQLDHPQVVKLNDFFIEDHRGYLVLEHIDGKSLRQTVDGQGKLPEQEVRQLAEQMCEILSYLHGLTPPVVHRDFTPDNLILRKDGQLKLVDFNVAQQTESTATGTVVGKHAYLPPEQFRGLPNTRSDIYAMGATLHYLLTASDPEPISVSHPKEMLADLSDDIDRIIARATHLDGALRYQTAEELLVDLKS